MKLGIIGSGNVGGTLTRGFRANGHEVFVANSRGPQSLTALAEETGARATTVEDAIRDGDVVVLAVPLKAMPALPADAFGGKVVIDATNYYPSRDGRIDAIETGTSQSRWIARQLHGATVVKAFNNIQMSHLAAKGRPAGAPDRVALPVAGDDEAAKRTAMGLVEELGFDALDAGDLDGSWRQQPGSPVYAADLDADGLRTALEAITRS